MSYIIEVSESIYKSLNQEAGTRNSSLDEFLELLLTLAPFVLPASDQETERESLQQEIIKLYATDLDYQELLSLKQILADFFARKAINEADKVWDKQNLSDEQMESWLNEG